MKGFLLFFLLSIMLVIAASVSEPCDQVKQILLKEIIDSVLELQTKHSHVSVEDVIDAPSCHYKNFCQAGAVLSKFKAEEFGLNESQWLLPRRLIAYTRNTNCNIDNSTSAKVSFFHFLKNIRLCAQKHYREC